MRFLVATSFACVLSACASSSTPTALVGAREWKIGQRADRVAGEPVQSAVVTTRSRNVAVTRQDPVNSQAASLQLMCFDGGPVIRFYFAHKVGSNRNSRLAYRFDNGPAVRPQARILQDFRTVMIEDDKDVAAFVSGLREAKHLDITLSSLTNGQTAAEFNVEGSVVAIEASFKTCPLPAAPPSPAGRR